MIRKGNMSLVIRKPAFCIWEKKTQISAFVFAIRIVQSLNYLNPKSQASSYLLWPHSPVCVGPGRKPRRLVFSQQGSYNGQLFFKSKPVYIVACTVIILNFQTDRSVQTVQSQIRLLLEV